MKVLKFGGTSQSLIGYDKLINIISNVLKGTEKLIIVLSAVSGVTNLLEKYIQSSEIRYCIDAIEKNKIFIDELNNKYNIKINLDDIFNMLLINCDQYLINNTNNHLKAKIIGYGEVISTNIFYGLITLIGLEKTESIKLLN